MQFESIRIFLLGRLSAAVGLDPAASHGLIDWSKALCSRASPHGCTTSIRKQMQHRNLFKSDSDIPSTTSASPYFFTTASLSCKFNDLQVVQLLLVSTMQGRTENKVRVWRSATDRKTTIAGGTSQCNDANEDKAACFLFSISLWKQDSLWHHRDEQHCFTHCNMKQCVRVNALQPETHKTWRQCQRETTGNF